MIPPNKSLVKYDNPVLLANASKSKSSQAKSDAAGSPSKNEKSHSLYQPEEILNAIIPPREWNEGGQVWVQHVSSSPATRLDVVNLQELLDNKLQQRKARETGICPVREELYKETFDEIIRQVTVNCAERGLLMIRVRDEIQMTRSAYQTLYESSIAFGIRKVLQAKQNRTAMRRTIERLLENNETLREEISMLKQKATSIEKNSNKLREQEKGKHLDEVAALKSEYSDRKKQLEIQIGLVQAPPAADSKKQSDETK